MTNNHFAPISPSHLNGLFYCDKWSAPFVYLGRRFEESVCTAGCGQALTDHQLNAMEGSCTSCQETRGRDARQVSLANIISLSSHSHRSQYDQLHVEEGTSLLGLSCHQLWLIRRNHFEFFIILDIWKLESQNWAAFCMYFQLVRCRY